ncbi:exonuclease 3'-5' domain-containing protein 2-like [Teleopsis dalmanni]|uniref:exonuclease 3'-5' domain-containing protein 2-like n=1 Tax=Teleopsis dalmanni TaxID=139649 RepID=UPI0018CD04D5|nr:exonuclease 3'-5' domain-containing protein 2-like [Teleopsis dalmanni]
MHSELQDFRSVLTSKCITVVQSGRKCKDVIRTIKSKCSTQKFIGYDAEWVTVEGKRKPVALLQLATADGYCALIRLCNMDYMPKVLSDFLSDPTILKLGVAPVDDALKLYNDYGLNTNGTFDLRYLAVLTGRNGGGLANLSKHVLQVQMDKSYYIRCSDWQADRLSQRQISYAAADAILAVDIYMKLFNELLQDCGLSKACQSIFPLLDVEYAQKKANDMRRQRLQQTIERNLQKKQKELSNTTESDCLEKESEQPRCSGHSQSIGAGNSSLCEVLTSN